MVQLIVVLSALVASAAAIPSPAHIAGMKRSGGSGCTSDNLLRNFKDKRYSVAASAFCSVYIQSTTKKTVSVTRTDSATSIITPSTVVVTKTDVITETETETIETTEYPTAVNTFVKRAAIPYPTWLAASYPPSRVSSACSCFVTPSPQATCLTTVTASTQTNTETTTLPTVTSTETTLTTESAQATTTAVTTGEQIYCGHIGCANGVGFLNQDYEGAGGITEQECIASCSSDCTHVQWGDDPANGFSFCNRFGGDVGASHDTGSSTDPTCQWTWYDKRCIV